MKRREHPAPVAMLDSRRFPSYKQPVYRWRYYILTLFLLLDAGLGYWWWYNRRDHSQDAPILAAARHYGVQPALVKAVVWRESRFNPAIRGRKGEIGLMQIRETAAKEWAAAEHLAAFAPEQLTDPGTNTLAGAWYLRKLIRRYPQTDDPLPYALADYNAGRANVLRWLKGAAETNSAAFLAQMDFPGTKNYIETIRHRYAHYQPIFPARTGP